MIGNALYQCSCVHYVTPVNIALIVGLSLGLGVLLILLITITSIAIRYCIRRSKLPGQQQVDTSTEQNNNDTGLYSGQFYMDYPYDYIPSSLRLNPRTPSGLDLLQTEHEHSWPTPRLNRNTAITENTDV